jgi:hypothetical protein
VILINEAVSLMTFICMARRRFKKNCGFLYRSDKQAARLILTPAVPNQILGREHGEIMSRHFFPGEIKFMCAWLGCGTVDAH